MKHKILKVKEFVYQGNKNKLTNDFINYINMSKYIKHSPCLDYKFHYRMLKTRFSTKSEFLVKSLHAEIYELGLNHGAKTVLFYDFDITGKIYSPNSFESDLGIMARLKFLK
jgi:phenolic acid decarboxylase